MKENSEHNGLLDLRWVLHTYRIGKLYHYLNAFNLPLNLATKKILHRFKKFLIELIEYFWIEKLNQRKSRTNEKLSDFFVWYTFFMQSVVKLNWINKSVLAKTLKGRKLLKCWQTIFAALLNGCAIFIIEINFCLLVFWEQNMYKISAKYELENGY